MDQTTKLTRIKGIGPRTAELYAGRGVFTAGDLLAYYPVRYEAFPAPQEPSRVPEGRPCVLDLTVTGAGSTGRYGNRSVTHLKAAHGQTPVRLTYFNMPYIKKSLPPGTRCFFRGILKRTKTGLLYMEQPAAYAPEEYASLQGSLQPVYSLTKGLKNSQVRKLVGKVLEDFSFPEDYMPDPDRQELGLISREEAVRAIHFPGDREALTRARTRLVFDEFFFFILSVRLQKEKGEDLVNPRPLHEVPETEALIRSLPFSLTGGQEKAWADIRRDLTGPRVMNRLLQGDVGSGKTILAFLALVMTAANGRQGALMAPTEVLAGQHYKALTDLKEACGLDIHPVLLTGSLTAAARKKLYAEIESGEADIIIGTHALFQEKVVYQDLALVITDEQHRFGVRQRETLAGKGADTPVLVMSATPIPRTLAIILYGDLQISELRDLPAGRLPIKNLAMEEEGRPKALRFILGQIREGRQAYIICPAVEEGEDLDLQNVTDYTEALQRALPEGVRAAALHGRMKSEEKNQVMEAYARGEIQILVSTTVIEVGINVPNASVMMVENSERFGLSQLHQLRGRVGRGRHQSYCIFLYKGEREVPERLKVLTGTNDGFKVAEEDLRLRGPGDVFGVRQSGELGFALADIYTDAGLMKKAAAYVDRRKTGDLEPLAGMIKAVDFRSI